MDVPNFWTPTVFMQDDVSTQTTYARGNDLRIYNAASIGSPVATLSIGSGTPAWNLISPGEIYTSLNGFSYVEASSALFSRGLQSLVQISNASQSATRRAIAQGRRVLTEKELALLDREFGGS